MLNSSRRELFRALRNQLKLSWRKHPGSENKSRIVRNRLAAASAATIFGSAFMLKNSQGIIDEEYPNKPLGSVYKFQEDQDQDELPLVYDVAKIQAYWSKRPKEVIRRTAEILSILLPYIYKLVIWEYLIRKKIRDHPGLQKKYAIQLREILTQLGPCFIKFGQAISIRPDILPSSFLFELQKLCDSVPSFPTQEAINVIEAELGPGSVEKLFEGILLILIIPNRMQTANCRYSKNLFVCVFSKLRS